MKFNQTAARAGTGGPAHTAGNGAGARARGQSARSQRAHASNSAIIRARRSRRSPAAAPRIPPGGAARPGPRAPFAAPAAPRTPRARYLCRRAARGVPRHAVRHARCETPTATLERDDMAAGPIDEVAGGDVPETEEDPYQVYMLRRPHERASNVVPQLPKQPEMAETRLRYRRIPAETRSGSLGSFGNHFPRRFEFPNRRSLLDSLTSDDESVASSFAMRRAQKRKDADKKKRKKKRASAKASTGHPSADAASALPPLFPAAAAAVASPAPSPGPASVQVPELDSKRITSWDPTADPPVPKSPLEMAQAGGMTLDMPEQAGESQAGHDGSTTPFSTSPTTPPADPPAAVVHSQLLSSQMPPAVEKVRASRKREKRTPRAKESAAALVAQDSHHSSSSAGGMLPAPTRTGATHGMGGPSPALSAPVPPEERETANVERTGGRGSRRVPRTPEEEEARAARRASRHAAREAAKANGEPEDKERAARRAARRAERRVREAAAAADAGFNEAADGRKICAPAMMSPSMREGFVLHAEAPARYGKDVKIGLMKEKRKKRKKRKRPLSPLNGYTSREEEEGGIGSNGSRTARGTGHATRSSTRPRSSPVSEKEFEHRAIVRDLSVSFPALPPAAHTATKPVSTLHKLMHALSLSLTGTSPGRGKR